MDFSIPKWLTWKVLAFFCVAHQKMEVREASLEVFFVKSSLWMNQIFKIVIWVTIPISLQPASPKVPPVKKLEKEKEKKHNPSPRFFCHTFCCSQALPRNRTTSS